MVAKHAPEIATSPRDVFPPGFGMLCLWWLPSPLVADFLPEAVRRVACSHFYGHVYGDRSSMQLQSDASFAVELAILFVTNWAYYFRLLSADLEGSSVCSWL